MNVLREFPQFLSMSLFTYLFETKYILIENKVTFFGKQEHVVLSP